MDSTKKTARIAGILYLMIIVCAGFSEGYVRSGLIIPGDAAATAANISADQGLFRIGIVSDLMAFISDAAVSILFYVLLRPAGKTIALLAAAFRLVAHPAIAAINLLNLHIGLRLLSGADLPAVFPGDQLQALALLFFNAHTAGYLIAGAFFGIHCLLLGFLLFKSNRFPGILGILLALAGAGYLTESFGSFLFPAGKQFFTWGVIVTAVPGEVLLAVWLTVKGVKGLPAAGMRS